LRLDPGSWVLKKSWVTGIDEVNVLHPDPELTIAGPALARNVVRFECRLPRPGRLRVYNALGRLVLDEPVSHSAQSLTWHCAAAPSGVYIAQLTTDRETVSRKVLIAH
jgi:hypothetical protein